jgi:hypothetical protein
MITKEEYKKTLTNNETGYSVEELTKILEFLKKRLESLQDKYLDNEIGKEEYQ